MKLLNPGKDSTFSYHNTLSPSLGEKENECLLVTIKTDSSGTVIIKPDFNKGREPYRQVVCWSATSAHLAFLAYLYPTPDTRIVMILLF